MNTDASRQAVAAELLSRLASSPDVYPQKVDFVRQAVLMIQFDAASYRAASFLDDRILTPTTKGGWVPAEQIAQAARQVAARPLHFIFHTGHVGSTLLSRLLDETGEVLGLREPLPLRTFADAYEQLGKPDSLLSEGDFAGALDAFARLWSRGYGTTQSVVVKATSSAGRLAAPLLSARPDARAIYLNLGAEPFLATLLAGANSPADLRGHGPERVRRLMAFGGTPPAPLHQLSIGELAALSWLVESLTQHDAIKRFPGRVIAMDFDRMLADVRSAMETATKHFGLAQDARLLDAIAQSPVLTRYAKGPEHGYSPKLREQILAQSRAQNGEQIKRGMAWLAQTARSNPVVDQLLQSARA